MPKRRYKTLTLRWKNPRK